MTTTNYRGKARAVFLAAIMVISMVGMPMAFAGSAAAATTSINLSDDLVQGGDEIDISGKVDSNGTVHVFIDEDNDGNYTSATDTSGSANIENYEEDNEFSVSLNAPTDSGTYDVYVFQDEGKTDSTIDKDDEGERSAPLQVDADAPTFGNETPEDGSAITAADEIVVPIEDANTSVQTITATAVVENADGTINTYEINPETADNDGVSWDGSELVIEPGVGNVPSIADGDYDVSVSATDEVGNSDSTTFSFTVDSNVPDSSFVTPGDNVIVNNENQTVDVSLSASAARSINDSTVSLDIVGDTTDYSESFVNTDDEYANSSDTFSVDPSVEGVESFADDTYTVTVSGEDDIGNSFSDTYSFEVDTTSPEVTNVELSETDLNSDSEDPTVTVNFNEPVDASEVSADVLIDGETKETLSFDGSDETVGATLDIGSYGAVENDSAVINVTSAQDIAGNDLANADADASQTGFAIDTDGPSVELGDVPNDGVLSGYVNASALIASTNDVDSTTVEIWVGGEEASSESYTAAESRDIDTRELPDGEHTIGVIVEDDAGNQDVALADFTLNNGNDLTVQSEYLPGARHNAQQYVDTGYEVPVDGQFNLSTDVFNYSGFEGDVTYDKGTETDVSGEDLVFDANNYNDGERVTLEASDDGETARVDVVVNRVTTTTLDTIDTNGNSDQTNPSEIVFESNRANLDELNMTVQPTDGYTDNAATSLARDDFSVVEDDENPGTYIYTANVPDLRDGQFNVTVDDVADGTQTVEPDLTSDNFDIDYTEPGLESAAVVDGDADGLTVRATFNESVSAPALGTISVEDVSTDATDIQWVDNAESGVADITFDAEFQTEDQPNLTITQGAIDETFDVDNDVSDSNSADNNAGIYTSVQTLEEGLNPMSIPAESGEVAISDIEVDGDLEAIWAYTDGEWEVYNGDENDFTTLEGGQGYLANVNEETTISLNAENVPSADNQALTAQQINEGWNFVGHYQEGSQSVEQALTYLDGTGATYQIEQGYTGDQVNQLDAEEGYWLFSNAESYHAHVDYNGANSDQPVVGNVQMTDNDGELTDGEDVEISAEVQHDTIVETVEVSAISELGIGTVELTDANNDGVYNTTEAIAFDGANAGDTYPVFVTATDVDGNAGSAVADSVSVDETAPTVTNVTLENTSSELNISFNTDEQLDTDAVDITVNVDRPSTNSVYNATQFNESEAGGTYTYELTASQGFDNGSGTYTASVDDAIDVVGNNGGNNGDVSGLTDDYNHSRTVA